MANQVAPTKNNLMAAKKSLKLARMGYDLLGRKKNILIREIMDLMKEAEGIQEKVDEAYAAAYEALKKAHLFMGSCMDFARSVPLDDSLSLKLRSVMGVELPVITMGEYTHQESRRAGSLSVPCPPAPGSPPSTRRRGCRPDK